MPPPGRLGWMILRPATLQVVGFRDPRRDHDGERRCRGKHKERTPLDDSDASTVDANRGWP